MPTLRAAAVIAAGTAAALGGYLGIEAYADQQLKQAIDRWRGDLPAGTSLDYGRIEAKGVDGAVLSDVTFKTAQPDEPLTVTAGTLRVDSASFRDDRLTALGAFEFEGARIVRDGDVLEIARGNGADLQLDESYMLAALGRAELAELGVDEDDGEMTARAVTLAGLKEARLDRLSIQALAIREGAGSDARRVLLDEIAVRDADFDDLEALGRQTDDPSMVEIVNALRGDGFGELAFSGLSVIDAGREIGGLDRLTLSLTPQDDGAIVFDMRYSGGYADATHPEAGYPMLAALGYERVSGQGGLTLAWAPEGGRFAVERLTMDLAEVGQLSLTGDIVGIPPVGELADTLKSEPSALRQQAALAGLRLELVDRGVAGRLIQMQARQTGQDPAEIRAQQAAMVRQTAQQMKSPALGEQIARFVEKPGRLTLTADPASPVAMGKLMQLGMMQPAELRQTLNLEAEASR
jgi:hypothetical protein